MRNTVTALLSVFTIGCMAADVVAAEQFTVGPDAAYTTISSALEKMQDGDVCVINAGVYRETIHIRQNDVILRGEGRVVITGCDAAGDMEPCVVNGRDGLKKAVGVPVYDAFCDGASLIQARYPDKTAPMLSNRDWAETSITPEGTVEFADSICERFPDLDDGYYVGLHGRVGSGKLTSWYSLTLPITGIGEDGSVHIDEANASSGFMGNYGQGAGLGYIIGAKAVLDATGEWYSDGNEVVLLPPADAAGAYEFRTRLYGAVISGDRVRLENIRFIAATARIDGADVSLQKCAFEYISPFRHNANDEPKNKRGQSMVSCWGVPENGSAGVYVAGDRFVAENCLFAKSWWCGMMVRGDDARIENCLFEDVNWIAKRCAGLFSWGDGNIVRHCTVRNVGAAGIEGGNAAWIGQYATNNIWEYNYIEDVCKMIVDQGFFYVNQQSGANPAANSIWRFNVGKHARGPEKGTWSQTTAGYYVDNSSSGYRIHHNIAIDAAEAMRYNDTREGKQAGRDIWYYNNTFYQCDSVQYSFWNPSEKARPDAEVVLVNNIAVASDTASFAKGIKELDWQNNFDSLPASVLVDPDAMDFAPADEELKTGGVPVLGEDVSYVGAVDPEKRMWRYGVDESKLPEPGIQR